METFFDMLTSWVAIALASSTWETTGNLFSLLLMATLVILFWKAHRDPNSPLNLSDLLTDSTGKIGGSQMRLNLAFLLVSWVVVYSTIKGNLNEWLFGAYLAAFVFDRMNARKSEIAADIPAAEEKR